ncbi:MAG: tetratricopeptide repeat protein [Nitrospirota bacterium]
MLFYSEKYDKVREFAQKVIGMYRNTNYSDHFMYNMQRLIADSLFKEKEYTKAEEEYKKARTFIKNEEQEMISEIDRLMASSIYKEAEKLREDGRTDEAIEEFIKVYKKVPSTDIASIALYDAGLLALNTGDTDRAVDIFNLLNKHYPYSEYTYKVTVKLAEIYEKEGELNKAASIYQRLALLSEDEDEASDAIFMAGLLYEKALNWDKVYTTFKIYIDNYGNNYEKVIKAMFKRANAKLKLNDQKEARRIFQLIVDLYGNGIYNSSKLNYLLAKSYFIIGEYLFDEYKEIRLNSPLEENLEKKNNLLEKVLDYYSHAEEYDIAEITTESTYKTGRAFENFRDALLKSERPSELTVEQLNEYNSILEEEAYPYQKKAIAAYKANIKFTHEFGLYDDWIKKSYNSLSKIFPVRYQKKELAEIVSTNLSF